MNSIAWACVVACLAVPVGAQDEGQPPPQSGPVSGGPYSAQPPGGGQPMLPLPGAGITAQKGAADCVSEATFNQMMDVGSRQGIGFWGFGTSKGSLPQDLLTGHFTCRALLDDKAEVCDRLNRLQGTGRMAQAATGECYENFYLFKAYRAGYNKDWTAAEESCRKWWEYRRIKWASDLKAGQVCGQLIEALKDESEDACKKLGQRVHALMGGITAQEASRICALYVYPTPGVCKLVDMDYQRKRCLERGGMLKAARARNPGNCPNEPRAHDVCRWVMGLDEKNVCDSSALGLARLYCEK